MKTWHCELTEWRETSHRRARECHSGRRNRISRGSERAKCLASRGSERRPNWLKWMRCLVRQTGLFRQTSFYFILRALEATEGLQNSDFWPHFPQPGSGEGHVILSFWYQLDLPCDNDFGYICTWALKVTAPAQFNLPSKSQGSPTCSLEFSWFLQRKEVLAGISVFSQRPKASSTSEHGKIQHKFYASQGNCLKVPRKPFAIQIVTK